MPRATHTPEDKEMMRRIIAETREALKDVVFVTPHQHPRPAGYRPYLPPNPHGIIIIDYITKL